MFSLKNITRAALLSVTLANGDLLSNAVAGSGVGTNLFDRAPSMVINAMGSGDGDIFVPGAPKEAMTAAALPAADLKEGFEMPDLGLDETLQSVMDFESKLFGEEDDAKLLAYLTELKGEEQGHAAEVKAAIGRLEEYRRATTGTGTGMGKEESDRAILIAEIFTAMLASSPVAMVAETIKALKASDEAPGIEELVQLKDMMADGLDSAEIESLQTFDGNVFVEASATTTEALDFVIDGMVDFAGGAKTTTTTEAPEVPGVYANAKHAGAVTGSKMANDDTTTASTTTTSTTSTSTTTSGTSTSSMSSSYTSSTSTAAPEAPTSAAPTTDTEASMAAEASVLQSKDEGDDTGSNNNAKEFLIPIIAAASALAGVIVTVGAIVVVRRRRRSVTEIDFQPNLTHQIPRVSVNAVYESQA